MDQMVWLRDTNFGIRLTAVKEDSRGPIEAICIRDGTASLVLGRIKGSDHLRDYKFSLLSERDVENFRITLLSVKPASPSIWLRPADYSAISVIISPSNNQASDIGLSDYIYTVSRAIGKFLNLNLVCVNNSPIVICLGGVMIHTSSIVLPFSLCIQFTFALRETVKKYHFCQSVSLSMQPMLRVLILFKNYWHHSWILQFLQQTKP